MNRQQMHSLGWLVSANPASFKLFSKPVSSGSLLCGLSFGFLLLSRSNPAESRELETYKGAPRVNPMRSTELRDWPYQVLFLQKMGSFQQLHECVVFCPVLHARDQADLGCIQKGVAMPSSVYFPCA